MGAAVEAAADGTPRRAGSGDGDGASAGASASGDVSGRGVSGRSLSGGGEGAGSSLLAEELLWVDGQIRRAPWHEVLWQHRRWLLCMNAGAGGSAAVSTLGIAGAECQRAAGLGVERPAPAFRPADHERPIGGGAAGGVHAGSPPQEEGVEASLLAGMSRHVSDQQRAAAHRWAQCHRHWCEQWRKPPAVPSSW
jgi:hypothetical protein